jgi:hypothetical protein
VDGFVGGQLGMESGGQQVALFHQNGQLTCTAQDFDAFADAADDGRADKNHLHRMVGDFRAFTLLDGTVHLPPVSVAFNGNINQAQALLLRVQNFSGHQDRPGTGAEDRFVVFCKPLDGFADLSFVQKLEHGGGLAAGQDEGIDISKIFHMLHQFPGYTDPVEHFGVHGEIALDSENTNRVLFLACHSVGTRLVQQDAGQAVAAALRRPHTVKALAG